MTKEYMIEQQIRSVLEQQQWIIVVNDVSQVPPRARFVELWKMYANGVAVTLSICDEEGQFVVYADMGHAGSGSDRSEYGRFSTVDAAMHEVTQACYRLDSTWET